ncbi:hypothetical protein I5T86_09565 [Stenotrophomonas maltophilia]|nr:hypothetical protein [Stenotrophomonas maltophilia]MBH1520820.1 hypothetical protein [Stenotrophomonas maltophilia]
MMLKAKPDELAKKLGEVGPIVSALVTFVQQNAWWLSPSLLLLAWMLKHVKSALGEPSVWKDLQTWVDEFRSEVYGALAGQYHHHHRVTLYRRQRRIWWWLPGTVWLMPFVRSAHTSKTNVRCFRIDPAKPGCKNGMAGRAWESEGGVHVENLPQLTPGSSDADFNDYSDKSNMSLKDLRDKPSSSRSYWAVSVRANGVPWGVLVLDSVDVSLNKKKADSAIKQHARVLSLLLTRV